MASPTLQELIDQIKAQNVSQFGPIDSTVNSYKEAAEYAAEAKDWADLCEQIYLSLKDANLEDIFQAVTDARNAAVAAATSASKAAATELRIQESITTIDGWIKDMSVTPFPYTGIGGETTIVLPEGFREVQVIYLNGGRQERGDDFLYDLNTRTITLMNPLSLSDRVTVLSSTIYEQTSTLAQILSGVSGADYVKTGDGESVQKKLDLLEAHSGASLVGYKNRKVSERLSDVSSLLDYPGAVEGKDVDSTAAFTAAYSSGDYVYLPKGNWFTKNLISNRTYGEGRVWCDSDNLFPDSGERVINPGISHQRNYLYRAKTWGNRERAAGWSLMVNNENGRPAVSGFASDNAMANYVNLDAMAMFISMRGNPNFFYTTAANTTYTEFTITAPEITADKKVAAGMLITTSHTPRMKGRVMSVDFSSNTITVSKWIAEGNSADGQIPTNGTRAVINGADKLWTINTNLWITGDNPANTACGAEIDIISDGSHGNPVEGYTVSNANNLGTPFNYGFRAIGNWLYSVYADAKQSVGLLHTEPTTAAVRLDNLTDSAWSGSTIILNTNYRKAASYLLKIVTGGVTHFSIDSRGQRSSQRESYGVIGVDTTLDGLSASEISCNNSPTTPITITLSGNNCVVGQKFNIRALGGGVTVGSFVLNEANGRFICLLYDGSTFLKRYQVA